MNLYGRLFLIFLKAFFQRQTKPPLTVVNTPFRVLPHDLDFNFHMNNGRYLTLMDLGRFDYMRQTGILFKALSVQWMPILGETQMSFFRPLNLFQSFHIETRVEFWDEKWFIMSQSFCRGDKVMARGYIRGLLRGPQGNIPPLEVMRLSPQWTSDVSSPSASPEIQNWMAMLDSIRGK